MLNKRQKITDMIIEIEYYKKDTLLSGKSRSCCELQNQFAATEFMYDKETDNFIELLCRNYGWTVIETDILPDYVYDRDVQKLYKQRSCSNSRQ